MLLRISKYDPSLRDASGAYSIADWTSVSDIGKKFSGRILGKQDYLAFERRYVFFLVAFLSSLKSEIPVRITDVEGNIRDWKNAKRHSESSGLDPILSDSLPGIGDIISIGEVADVAKACLRSFIWAKFEVGDVCTFGFGYDYYIYIWGRSVGARAAVQASRLGLFSERRREIPF